MMIIIAINSGINNFELVEEGTDILPKKYIRAEGVGNRLSKCCKTDHWLRSCKLLGDMFPVGF